MAKVEDWSTPLCRPKYRAHRFGGCVTGLPERSVVLPVEGRRLFRVVIATLVGRTLLVCLDMEREMDADSD